MKTVKTCGPKGSPHAQWYASDVLLISCEEQHAPEDNLQSWICLLLFLPTVTNFADSKTFTPVLCNTFHLAVLVSQTCEFMGRHPSGTFFPIYPDFIFTLLIMCERRETNLVPVKKSLSALQDDGREFEVWSTEPPAAYQMIPIPIKVSLESSERDGHRKSSDLLKAYSTYDWRKSIPQTWNVYTFCYFGHPHQNQKVFPQIMKHRMDSENTELWKIQVFHLCETMYR